MTWCCNVSRSALQWSHLPFKSLSRVCMSSSWRPHCFSKGFLKLETPPSLAVFAGKRNAKSSSDPGIPLQDSRVLSDAARNNTFGLSRPIRTLTSLRNVLHRANPSPSLYSGCRCTLIWFSWSSMNFWWLVILHLKSDANASRTPSTMAFGCSVGLKAGNVFDCDLRPSTKSSFLAVRRISSRSLDPKPIV